MDSILNQETLYLWSTPFFTLVIFFEMIISAIQKKKNYEVKDTATNVYFALLNIGLDLIMKTFSFLVMGFFYTYSIVTWENENWIYFSSKLFGKRGRRHTGIYNVFKTNKFYC